MRQFSVRAYIVARVTTVQAVYVGVQEAVLSWEGAEANEFHILGTTPDPRVLVVVIVVVVPQMVVVTVVIVMILLGWC
ncbi:innexin unc-9-like X8 [Biomphalaria glabrata]|nr:innexin unc-9 X8 [Biomphalaria glabrata]